MFKRGIESMSDLGIGRLSNIKSNQIWNALACIKNFTPEELQIIYGLIQKRNINLDGVAASTMSYSDWVRFNNKIVNGIKSARRRKAKTTEFVPGDVIAVIINGTEYKGFVSFHDYHTRTKVIKNKYEVDKEGRIRAYYADGSMSVIPDACRILEGKEKEDFELEYKSTIKKREIEECGRSIQQYYRWITIKGSSETWYVEEFEKAKARYFELTGEHYRIRIDGSK